MSTGDELLTIREVSDRTGRSVTTLRHWAREGRIEGARHIGRDWFVPELSVAAIDAIQRRNRRTPK